MAVVLIGTAIAGFCPLYRLFGLSSLRRTGSEKSTGEL